MFNDIPFGAALDERVKAYLAEGYTDAVRIAVLIKTDYDAEAHEAPQNVQVPTWGQIEEMAYSMVRRAA